MVSFSKINETLPGRNILDTSLLLLEFQYMYGVKLTDIFDGNMTLKQILVWWVRSKIQLHAFFVLAAEQVHAVSISKED